MAIAGVLPREDDDRISHVSWLKLLGLRLDSVLAPYARLLYGLKSFSMRRSQSSRAMLMLSSLRS